MTDSPRALVRFFLLLLRPRAAGLAIASLVVAFGCYLEWTYPDGFDQAVAITLFLQLFSASSGYRERLRRGHFDPILAGTHRRWAVAFVHWLLSVAPGLSVWLGLGIIDLVSRTQRWPTPLTGAGLAVMLYVSTVVWTISLPMARYAGGVVWLAITFGLAATQRLEALRLIAGAAGSSWRETIRAGASGLVCPVFVLADPAAAGTSVLAILILATGAAWLSGALMIRRFTGILCEAPS